MAKDEAVDKLRQKLIKDNQAMFQGIAKSMKGSSDEQIAKMQDKYFTKLTQQALEERNKQAIERQAERDKIRIEEIKNDLKTKQGLTDAVAETLAKSANEREKREEKNATGLKKMFISLKKGFQKTPEEKKEEAARQGGFLGALKGMMAGKGDAMGKGAKGMFGGIMKTIKKVFSVLQIKFLLIAGFVAFAISKLKIKDLKKMWEAFTEGLAAVWKFLKPIVAYLATWIEESVLPNLVDFFVDTFKSIAEMFGKITERFSGWSDMSLWEKVQAIFGALFDFGETIMNIAGNIVAKVAAMFGLDGKFFSDLWGSIMSIPNAFLDDLIEVKNGITDKWSEWFPEGVGVYLVNKVFTPLKDWFNDTFSFGSWKEVLQSFVTAYFLPAQIIKDVLINPAAKWLGEKFGFDTSKFTEFSVGEILVNAWEKIINWFTEKFDIKWPEINIPSPKELVKMMAPAEDSVLWKVPGTGFIKDWIYSKEPDKPEEPKIPKPPVTNQLKKPQWRQREAAEWARKTGGNASDWTKAMGGKGKIDSMYGSYKSGDMAEPSKMATSRSELEQIKKDEGFREGVYKDTMGIKTIGYGFNLERAGSQEALDAANITSSLEDLKSGKMQLTEEEASRLMMGEMGHFRKVAENYVGKETWGTLGQNKQGILTNMAYNMGEGTLKKFKNLKAAIIDGDWKQAQAEMKDSNWAKQVKGRSDRLIARMGENDSGGQLGAAQQESTRLASNTNNGPPVVINKSDSSQSSNTQVIQPKNPRNPNSQGRTLMTAGQGQSDDFFTG